MYLVFIPIWGTELLKCLECPKCWEPEWCLLLGWWGDFWKAPKDGGWLPGEPATWLEGWTFQSIPRPLRGERGWRLNQSPLTNDLISHTFIKTQKGQGWESFQLVNMCRFPECVVPGEGMESLHPFPTPCLMHIFHLAVPELYPFVINRSSSE